MAGALELLLFHRLERDCYHRLVRDLDQEADSMRWVMALWLWFESVGHHDFVRRVSALPGPVVLRFVDEAVACLSRLVRHDHKASASESLPCTNALLNEPLDGVAYFDAHRDEVMDGVSTLYKNVCSVIFRADGDNFMRNVDNANMVTMAAPPPPPTWYALPTAPLNAMATPWFPPVQQQSPLLPDDYRSLFITFSRGYPISKEDITDFFNSVYGPCVEAVMIEKAAPGQQPVYGRVVMRTPAMIPVVLDGQQTAKYMIKGRHLWVRIYVPSSKPLPVYI